MRKSQVLEMLREVERDLTEAEQDFADAQERVVELRHTANVLRRKLEGFVANRQTASAAKDQAASASPDGQGGKLADQIEKALLEMGPAEHVEDILETMFEMGFITRPAGDSTRTLQNTIYSTMRRAPERFKKVGKAQFALVQPEENEQAAIAG